MDLSVYTCMTASEGGPPAETAIKALSEQPHLHVKMGAQHLASSLEYLACRTKQQQQKSLLCVMH